MELDGITVKLTAKMEGLIPGMWYHLKIIVCQTDTQHGDGVFIGNLDLGYAGGSIGGPTTGDNVVEIDDLAVDENGAPTIIHGNRPCTYPMKLTFDPVAAMGQQIADIEYIADAGHVFSGSALQDPDGNPLFPVDTIQLTGIQDTAFNYEFKVSPNFDGFVSGQYAGLVIKVRGGGGDTVFYRRLYDTLSWDVRYRMQTEVDPASLNLNIQGASPYLYRSIDGGANWKPVSAGFSRWELMYIGETCDILLYQPFQCCYDTIKIRMASGPLTVQRYVDIPGVPGFQDFSFTARYTAGEPLSVRATGYYSSTLLDLDKTAELQDDGSCKYTIYKVVEPWTVSFIPKENSGDVATGRVEEQSVWSSGGTLYIKSPQPCVATVYTLTGVLCRQEPVDAQASIRLPRGFYIVSVNNRQYKVVIKE